MKYCNKYTKEEIEAAQYTLSHYRVIFPTLEDIEDEVIVEDIMRCRKILAYSKLLAEGNKIVSEIKPNTATPWFLKGPKSQAFKNQLESCLEQQEYGEVKELYDEILQIKNKYAYNRYMHIFNYVINNKQK